MVNCLVGFCLTYLFCTKYGTINRIDKNARCRSTTITTTVCIATRKFPETTGVQKQIVKQQDILQKILLKQGKREKGSNTFCRGHGKLTVKPEEEITFPAYFKRYETIFAKRCQSWSDEEKIMLVLQKLGAHENTIYTKYILPNKPEEMLFEETIETLSKIFGQWDSLFHTYKYIHINV